MRLLCFDGHVHIQENFELGNFLLHGLTNFIAAAGGERELVCFLLLTESAGKDVFTQLEQEQVQPRMLEKNRWRIEKTNEETSLRLFQMDHPSTPLVVVAGQQIVTKQRLEVLALGVRDRIADGFDLGDTVDKVRKRGGLAVLPWGFGKWLGARAKVVAEYLKSCSADHLFVGDNGGRPVFWPTPELFRQAAQRNIGVLPGSDPLALAGEEKRVGSYGGIVEGECGQRYPWRDLSNVLTATDRIITPFGRRQGVLHFIRNQVGIRL